MPLLNIPQRVNDKRANSRTEICLAYIERVLVCGRRLLFRRNHQSLHKFTTLSCEDLYCRRSMVFTEDLLTRCENSTACLGTLKVVVERTVAFVAAYCRSVTTAAKTLQLCTPRASLVHIVDQASVRSFPYLRAPQCTRRMHPEPIRHGQKSTQASIFIFRARLVYIASSRKAPVVVSAQMTQTAFSWVVPLGLAVSSIDLSIPP
jgi:hypothetical protein